MKYLKTYEALTIKQYRPYHREGEKAGYKERYNEIFQKYKEKYSGDRNAFRIYIPLVEEKKKSQTQNEVEFCLKQLGIDVLNPDSFDYVSGMAKFPSSKNWTKIGKILMKKPEWKEIYKHYQEDFTRTLKSKSDLEVCISRHPYDVAGADTDRPWINCMTLYHYNRFKKEWFAKGQSVAHLLQDVRQGSLVAFLIDKSDRNIQHPLANVTIKPYLNEQDPKDYVLVPDNRMYGVKNIPFFVTVFNWCDEVNGKKIGYYKIAKGLHMDNFKRADDMSQLGQLADEEIKEYPYQDPRSYYALRHLPPDRWKGTEYENLPENLRNDLFEKMEPRYYILKGNNQIGVKLIDYDEYDSAMPYYVKYIDGDVQWLSAGKFSRDMTKEEIIEFEKELELVKNKEKYNL